MSQPYGMHIIHTDVEECRTLRYKIPSPFSPNTVITVACELQLQPDGRLGMEVWGEVPKITDASSPEQNPDLRGKLASAIIPYPSVSQ